MPSVPPRIIITPGEPAGIGPDLVLAIASQAWDAEIIVVCDPELLWQRAKILNLPISLIPADLNAERRLHERGTLKFIATKLSASVSPGILDSKNSAYVLTCLQIAIAHCLSQQADVLVTGPVHKGIINDAGIAFSGHTEFLAQYCKTPEVLMLFVVDDLKIAIATTHIPLCKVANSITPKKLLTTIRLFHTQLQRVFSLSNPLILVSGLNPHAGEGGHLGTEEIEVIQPVLQQLQQEKINVVGPIPADTLFTKKYLDKADAILAMYHDQALPIVKYIGFDRAVNVTLGLPFIRTSVDHGTALELAGKNLANSGSLTAAIQLGIDLKKNG